MTWQLRRTQSHQPPGPSQLSSCKRHCPKACPRNYVRPWHNSINYHFQKMSTPKHLFPPYLVLGHQGLISLAVTELLKNWGPNKPAKSYPILGALCVLRLVKFCQQHSQALRINSLAQSQSWSDQCLSDTRRNKHSLPNYLRVNPK